MRRLPALQRHAGVQACQGVTGRCSQTEAGTWLHHGRPVGHERRAARPPVAGQRPGGRTEQPAPLAGLHEEEGEAGRQGEEHVRDRRGEPGQQRRQEALADALKYHLLGHQANAAQRLPQPTGPSGPQGADGGEGRRRPGRGGACDVAQAERRPLALDAEAPTRGRLLLRRRRVQPHLALARREPRAGVGERGHGRRRSP
mmetsp:Transcript_117099/g.311404  ORF Transcript_117099/g.311404 Transcript_117099/m.311404 type:complete len:200 (+) Transcript_117099:224-823(+)